MTVGFATSLDVDLDLVIEDREPCLRDECDSEAVMAGIISSPCGCPQPLCLQHYEFNRMRFAIGDEVWCYFCVATADSPGRLIRWERL